jgi:hypothetical protein
MATTVDRPASGKAPARSYPDLHDHLSALDAAV